MMTKNWLRVSAVVCVVALSACGGASKPADENAVGKAMKGEVLAECIKDASSGEGALPPALATSVCGCSIDKLFATHTLSELRELDKGPEEAMTKLEPLFNACAEVEVPKYLEQHPEFLEQFVEKNPDVLEK